jgi:hypothetical protein
MGKEMENAEPYQSNISTIHHHYHSGNCLETYQCPIQFAFHHWELPLVEKNQINSQTTKQADIDALKEIN